MKNALLAFLFLFLLSALPAQGASYYVSASTGNDTWSGLLATPSGADGPFKTLAAVQNAMRASSTNKTATIETGTYSIASNLVFTSSDDGETWLASSGETVILDGGGTGYISGTATTFTFEGFTIQHTGSSPDGQALHWSGAGPSTFRWNTFVSCAVNCFGGQMSGTTFDSNTTTGAGTGGFHGAVVFWYGASGNQITHNLIQNSNEMGISIQDGPSDPVTNNNIIDRNIVTNACTATSDCGGIYIFEANHAGTGNQITNNIVSLVGGSSWTTTAGKAIYLDDEVSNIVVTGNVCWRCGEWAVQIHGGDHVTMENNIFDLSSAGTQLGLYQKSAAYPDYGMAANLFEHNLIYSATSFPSSLWQVGISGTDALPTDTTNLYFSANSSSIPNTNIVDVNRILANPQFTNPSVGDYSMPSNSPAFTSAGFQPLPTDQGPVGQASFAPIGTSSKPAPPTNVKAVVN
jgi:parallel beta-helix repeat protein